MKVNTFAIASCLFALSFGACTRTQTTTNFDDPSSSLSVPVDEASNTMDEDMNKSKTILYTMPAPIEMASIIKESNVRLDDQLLNDLSRAPKYATNSKMALNLGVYAMDMSVSGMFNQSQRMVDYFNVFKDLTSRLGIVKVLDEDAIRKLESTDITKDEILRIISDVYVNTNQYLVDNNRRNISTLVMAGGWIEGLYLALNLIDTKKLSVNVAERLIAQKLTLATMYNIIDSMDPDAKDQDMVYVRGKLDEIKTVYDFVSIGKTGSPKAVTDADTKTTAITAKPSAQLDPEVLDNLKDKVSEVRNEFINM